MVADCRCLSGAHGVRYLSYESFRQIYALPTVRQHLDPAPFAKFDVLMIGDGYGFFSVLIKNVYPELRIMLVGADPAQGARTNADFLYCPTANLKSIRKLKYKLIVTIESMQEMDYPAIARYFHLKSERRRRQSLTAATASERSSSAGMLSNFQNIRGGMSDTEK